MPLLCPPLAEQRAIAAYLDRETARLDALVAAKERLIALLREKRAALISRAVTRGLDPAAPLKDSGVSWLGQIPAHWQVKRLKYLTEDGPSGIQIGPFGGMLTQLEELDTGFKVYGQENTISGDFSLGQRWITAPIFHELREYTALSGDILLTRKGSIGNARIFPEGAQPGIIDSDTIRVRANGKLLRRAFLVWLLHEAWYVHEQVFETKRGAILAGLNTSTIANLRLLVPPLDEQRSILAYLDRETAKLDALVAAIRRHIEKVKEYRAALIAAAVTGKIDVRERGEVNRG